MSHPRQHLVDRTKFVFAVPAEPTALGGTSLLAVAAGAIAVDPSPIGVGSGIAVLGVPALLATWLTGPLDRGRGGPVTTDRSAFLALATAVVVAAFLLGAVVVRAAAGVGPSLLTAAALTAAAGTFGFRLLVLLAVSGPPLADRVAAAAVQPLATVGALALVAGAADLPPVTSPDLAVAALLAVLYAGVVVGLVRLVDGPLGRSHGISGFEFLHRFLAYVADGTTEVEAVFESLGVRDAVPVSVLAVRGLDGAEIARVVVPLAHPGPLAGLGGGTLPYRLDEAGAGLVFAPHGLAGHAYDPASARDVEAICAAADAAVDAVSFERSATAPVSTRAGPATVGGQRFGDGSFLVTTFAPEATDDVARSVGVEAIAAARGPGDPVVTDAHNARATDRVDDGRTTPGSPRATALVEAVDRAASSLEAAPAGPLQAGVAADPTPFDVADGIGPLGVRVLATTVEDATAAYVLVDGNNMVPELRSALRRAVRDAVPEVDLVTVSTTDTHAVNRLDSTNYVGRSVPWEGLADRVAATAAAAVADRRPATAGTAIATADATVLGEGTIDEIAAFTDRVLPVCGAFVLGASLFVTGVAVALFWLVAG